MAWLDSITEAGTIVESKKYMLNVLWTIFGVVKKYTQTRVVTVTTYPGLTQAAAETAAQAAIAEDDATDAHTTYNGAGAYTMQKTIDVYGDWELVEP